MPITEGADSLASMSMVKPVVSWRTVGTAGNPAFYAGWSQYGGNYRPVEFCIDSSGWVKVRGSCKQTGSAVSIFTLPSGYRPLYTEVFNSVVGNAYLALQVDSSGLVYVSAVAGGATSNLTQVSLSEIYFDPAGGS